MKYNKIVTAFSMLFVILLGACSEYTDTEEPSPVITDNQGMRFSDEYLSKTEVLTSVMSFPITLVRNGSSEFTLPLTVADTGSYFNVPESVFFPAGVDTITFDATLKDTAPLETPIGLTLAFDDSLLNPYYAESSVYKTEVIIYPPCAFNVVYLNLFFDGYASECTWAITNASDEIVYESEEYADGTESAHHRLCLEDEAVYTFTINDVYGDGLTYPEEGSVTLTYDDEEVFMISGDYGASKSVNFTLVGGIVE
ncbi:hypothetical protein ACT3CD_12635 [Geofilum sp. OHC36d9]|uniref:hypothetical protein n=1 Tax=Geofilum sp. OHC36d9 TaxID=3458413 RepID=UPI004034DC57